MTDTPFSANEVRELEGLGFKVTGADEAEPAGQCWDHRDPGMGRPIS